MRPILFARVVGTVVTVLAFLVLRPAGVPASSPSSAILQPLASLSCHRLAANVDRRGSFVYLIIQEVAATARVQAVHRVVTLIAGGTLDYAQVSARPDATGLVTIPLHLPATGAICVI